MAVSHVSRMAVVVKKILAEKLGEHDGWCLLRPLRPDQSE